MFTWVIAPPFYRHIAAGENHAESGDGSGAAGLQQTGSEQDGKALGDIPEDRGKAQDAQSSGEQLANRETVGQPAEDDGREGKYDRVAGDDPGAEAGIDLHGRNDAGQGNVEHRRVHEDEKRANRPDWDRDSIVHTAPHFRSFCP